jgi:hypothetical protein
VGTTSRPESDGWCGCCLPKAAFTTSLCGGAELARGLDVRCLMIFGVDVISILLGVLMFGVLIALVYGIDRI